MVTQAYLPATRVVWEAVGPGRDYGIRRRKEGREGVFSLCLRFDQPVGRESHCYADTKGPPAKPRPRKRPHCQPFLRPESQEIPARLSAAKGAVVPCR